MSVVVVDIKRSVEKSENSLRDDLAGGRTEDYLRRWLHRQFDATVHKKYTVTQESEIDYGQRPDLRVEAPGVAPVLLEVKWADKWTYAQLIERLETQVVGQYLRAHGSRYALYILGRRNLEGGKQNWKDSSGRPVSFEELALILTSRASELISKRSDIEQMKIETIDFRPTPSD